MSRRDPGGTAGEWREKAGRALDRLDFAELDALNYADPLMTAGLRKLVRKWTEEERWCAAHAKGPGPALQAFAGWMTSERRKRFDESGDLSDFCPVLSE